MAVEGDRLVMAPRRLARVRLRPARPLDLDKARQESVGRRPRVDLVDLHG
jgi:hypothetical protein